MNTNDDSEESEVPDSGQHTEEPDTGLPDNEEPGTGRPDNEEPDTGLAGSEEPGTGLPWESTGGNTGQYPEPEDSPYASQTQAPPHPGPMPQRPAPAFFGWLRNLGLRRGRERWIGGVGSGVAERLGIDPVIVRGILVLLALFFGVGLLAYGVAWALLPEPDGRIHAEEVGHGHWSSGMTGAAIFTLVGLVGPGRGLFFRTGDGWFPWPILWVAAVVALVVWALNREKTKPPRRPDLHHGSGGWAYGPQPYRPAQPPAQGPFSDTAPGTAARAGYPQTAPGPGYPGSSPGAGYPGSPSGAGYPAPQPYQSPARVFPPRVNTPVDHRLRPEGAAVNLRTVRRHHHPGAAAVAISTGVAILVAGAVLLLNTAGLLPLGGYAAATAWAAAAITLGLGIVVSGLRGRTTGGLGFFAIVALLVAGSLSLVPHNSSWALARNGSWSPASIGSAEEGFSIAMGRGDITLAGLAGSAPLARDVVVPVNLAAAEVDLTVPANIPVSIQSEVAATQITVDGQDTAAATVGRSTTSLNQGAPGHKIILQLRGAAGHVNITISGSGNTQ